MHSAITSAIGTLKGPLHGGANEQVMKMLLRIGTVEASKKFIEDALNAKEKVMGIGHRVYKHGDPRARILRKMSQELTARAHQPQYYEMSANIDDIMQEKKRPHAQRRLLLGHGLLLHGHSDRSLYADLRGQPRERVDRPYSRAIHEQPHLSPARAIYGKLDQAWIPADRR